MMPLSRKDCLCARPTQIPREPRCALVDAALALDEFVQRLGMGLDFQRVSQDARPFGPRSFVYLCGIGCAADDCSEQVFMLEGAEVLKS
jgi:hypothetical protein